MKGGKYIYQASRLVSFGGMMYLGGRGAWEGFRNLYQMICPGNYTKQQIAGQAGLIGLNVFSCIVAGRGLVTDTRTLGKMLQQDGVFASIESMTHKIGDSVSSFVSDNSGKLDIGGFKGGSKTNTPLSLQQALEKLDASGLRPGQTELHMSQLNSALDGIQNNYNPTKAYSSVYLMAQIAIWLKGIIQQ